MLSLAHTLLRFDTFVAGIVTISAVGGAFLSLSFFSSSYLFLVHLCMCGDYNSKKSSFFPLEAKKL
jgi:hypothetical protein